MEYGGAPQQRGCYNCTLNRLFLPCPLQNNVYLPPRREHSNEARQQHGEYATISFWVMIEKASDLWHAAWIETRLVHRFAKHRQICCLLRGECSTRAANMSRRDLSRASRDY